MPVPGYTADLSLTTRGHASNRRARTPSAGVVAQARWRGGPYRISMEECWQACINGVGDCPPECADVPWPTIPPPPPRYLSR
jgi:hypothetical protein